MTQKCSEIFFCLFCATSTYVLILSIISVLTLDSSHLRGLSYLYLFVNKSLFLKACMEQYSNSINLESICFRWGSSIEIGLPEKKKRTVYSINRMKIKQFKKPQQICATLHWYEQSWVLASFNFTSNGLTWKTSELQLKSIRALVHSIRRQGGPTHDVMLQPHDFALQNYGISSTLL